MQLLKWLENKTTSLSNFFNSFKEKFQYLINPVNRYHFELNTLLAPRNEASQLYDLLNSGRSAAQLFTAFENMAESTKIPQEQSARAALLLGVLYRENISVPGFTLKKNVAKEAFYTEKAVKILGANATFSDNAKKYLACIMLGGEPQYAYQTLLLQAETGKNFALRAWSSKVLSYIYDSGCEQPNFKLPVNSNLAEKYRQKAVPGIRLFDLQLNKLTDKLIKTWFDRPRAFELVKEITTTQNEYAQYEYAKLLENKHANPDEFLTYYKNLAQKKPATALTFKTKGYMPAKKYLINAIDIEKFGAKDQEAEKLASHYRFDITMADKRNSLQNKARLIDNAKQGGRIANLQAALYGLKTQLMTIKQIESFYAKALRSREPLDENEQKMQEKICDALLKHYEDLFIQTPASFNFQIDDEARKYLDKIIFYLRQVPASSAKYEMAQYQMAHYQQFFLKQHQQAMASYNRVAESSKNNFESGIVYFGFRNFWETYKQQLSKDDCAKINKYENNKKPFYEQMHEFESKKVKSKNLFQLADELVSQIEVFLKEKLANKIEALPGFADFKEMISLMKAESDSADSSPINEIISGIGRFNPTLMKICQQTWDGNKRRTHFFANKTQAFSEKIRSLFTSYLDYIPLITQSSSEDLTQDYFTTVTTAYFQYVIHNLTEILRPNENKEETPGAMMYAKPE